MEGKGGPVAIQTDDYWSRRACFVHVSLICTSCCKQGVALRRWSVLPWWLHTTPDAGHIFEASIALLVVWLWVFVYRSIAYAWSGHRVLVALTMKKGFHCWWLARGLV